MIQQPQQGNPTLGSAVYAGTCAAAYRFGFNGKENDNEVFGSQGTFQDYGWRSYDTRLGRFISVDPLTRKFPHYSPYQFAGNKVISSVDLDGLEEQSDELLNEAARKGKAFLRQATEQVVKAGIVMLIQAGEQYLEYKLNEVVENSEDPEAIAYAVGAEFVLGVGPETRSFGPNHPFTKSLAQSELTTRALEAFRAGYEACGNGERALPPTQYRVDFTYFAPLDGGEVAPVIDGDLNAGEFVGTAMFYFSVADQGKTLNVSVYDTKNEYSFLFHMPGTDRHSRDERPVMGETTQTYDFSIWSSPLTYRTRLQWQNCKLCPYEQQTEVQQGREAADRA